MVLIPLVIACLILQQGDNIPLVIACFMIQQGFKTSKFSLTLGAWNEQAGRLSDVRYLELPLDANSNRLST
jgi:hypothetical protein